MIIWVASYPRSGNQYFQLLLWHFYRYFPYSLYLHEEFAKRDNEIINRWKTLFGIKQFRSIDMATMHTSSEMYFVKTHELPQDDFPAIYLVRDGRDVLISYTHFILTFETPKADFESTLRHVMMDSKYFGGWGKHLLAWTQRQAPTIIVKFEELVRSSNSLNIVNQALNGVGCQSPETPTISPLPSFEKLHQILPELFRRGQVGGWKMEMPATLQKLFWKKHGAAMRQMGYLE